MPVRTPLVSIIIPTFNRAHLIGETLDSVLAQTYQNWECIVVDDGSMDNTSELMSEYIAKDTRFQYHHRPKNRPSGGNAARNYGIEVSRGEFLNFLDSDDVLYNDALKIKLLKALENNADIVISAHTRHLEKLSSIISKEDVFSTDTFDLDFILSRNSILIGEPLINRRALKEIKFDENLVRSQDYDFLLRLFRQRLNFCRIDARLYYYRVNQDSISNKAGRGVAKESRTQLGMIKKYLEEYKGNIAIEEEYYRGIRKMYRSLIQKKRIDRILENFNFYRKGFKLSYFEFVFYFLCNLLFKKGFDRMKKNIS